MLYTPWSSVSPQVVPLDRELAGGAQAARGVRPTLCSLLPGISPVLKLSKNPHYFLKPNYLSLTLVWCQPGLQESLLSTVMVAKKLPHLLKMKTKQNKKITSPASVKSKDTRQQFKQSPCIQTNKDACQGLRGKKWHSCSTTLAKLYEPFYFQGCRQMPPEIQDAWKYHTHTYTHAHD